ncbi:MAG TPA: hypothetical protein PKK30_16650 [Nitrospira sp.]|nr:hypothetical protein [Nitrospira sp.]HNO35956.1 hypothetical protein [Nitrospira sp.]
MPKPVNIVFLDRGGSTFVEYIGKTDEYFDALYGTGMWEKHKVKEVVSDVARKMLEHPDQYVEADITGLGLFDASAKPVGEIKNRQEEDDSREQHARDAIARMEKDDLKQFVMTNFRVSIDGRIGVEKMREKAVELVDRFGIS